MCADLSQDKCGELSHLASPDGGGGREREGTSWGKGNACGGHDFYSSPRGPQDKPHCPNLSIKEELGEKKLWG